MNEFVVIVDPMENKDDNSTIFILNPDGTIVNRIATNYDRENQSLYVDGIKKPMKNEYKKRFNNNFYIAPFVINSLNVAAKFYFATEDENEMGIMTTALNHFLKHKPNSISEYVVLTPSGSKKYLR